MKCAHCGKEIKDKFYLLRGGIYCPNCIREDTLKVFYLGKMEEIFYEGDVESYENKYQCKDYILQKIKSTEERLKECKNKKENEVLIAVYEMNLREYQSIYNKIKEEHPNEFKPN